jgi:hypothetical protein
MKTLLQRIRPSAHERGSAYLLVLLLLLVLTVIGLSLAVITQTEVQIGGAERTATRVLYGADAGLRIQFMLSRFRATRPWRYELDPSTTDFAGQLQLDVSPFLPTYTGPCNLCSVNYGDQSYWLINYATNAQARRVSVVDGTTVVQASKLTSGMFYVQPEQERPIDESIRIFDQDRSTDDSDTGGLEVIRY